MQYLTLSNLQRDARADEHRLTHRSATGHALKTGKTQLAHHCNRFNVPSAGPNNTRACTCTGADIN